MPVLDAYNTADNSPATVSSSAKGSPVYARISLRSSCLRIFSGSRSPLSATGSAGLYTYVSAADISSGSSASLPSPREELARPSPPK
ncbi:hypothetical protein D3C76_1615410 [compost metagenome]